MRIKIGEEEEEEDEASLINALMLASTKLVGEETRNRRCGEGRGREKHQLSLLAMNGIWAGGGAYWCLGILSGCHLPPMSVCICEVEWTFETDLYSYLLFYVNSMC